MTLASGIRLNSTARHRLRPVRIALTHAYSWPEVRRGAERFLPALAAALARRGHQVVHYSSAWDPFGEERDGVRTKRLRRRFNDANRHELDFGLRLLPRLAAATFDVVHSLGRHDAVASIRAARLHPRRRTVITDLGLPNPGWWEEQGRREARAAAKVVRKIDVYSCMSRCAVDYLAESYGRRDGVVVPGGVDLDAFRPAEARAPKPTILFSGAIAEPRKGVPVLLEALPTIADAEPEVELWLSGPGDPEPMLAAAPSGVRERTRALGLGEAERQRDRYGRAWITCLPSTHDSFGMALVESLACGTPVVTTTHSAPKEVVQPGVTGELCEPHDPPGLAAACVRAFALTRSAGIVDTCRSAAEVFDWDRSLAPLVERLYTGDEAR
jgi:phosphatidylinositol alpha-mannosyltransferase